MIGLQLGSIGLALLLAPLYGGLVRHLRARLQNRRGPSLLQEYFDIYKLLHKESVVGEDASALFLAVPYLIFALLVLVSGMIPWYTTAIAMTPVADAIVLVGLLGAVRMLSALAAMDQGTAFGSLGARRDLLVGFLAEPALLTVLFIASMSTYSTSLSHIVETLLARPPSLDPSMLFAAIAFCMVALAENARLPVDNPDTHLELTMIHEAMLLETSGRHLALMNWAYDLKLLIYSGLAIALFCPWGIATGGAWGADVLALLVLMLKLLVLAAGLALLETMSAKLRIFRVPEFLGTAFMFGVMGMLVHVLLEA